MPANQRDRAAPHENLHILLAEDNAVNQTVATGLLRKLGHTVATADDGREALDLLKKQIFDLVLMDVQMPVMDGLTATKRIREDEKRTQTRMPIIALTAHALKGDRERCVAAGMDGYVPKPIDYKVLGEEIKTVLTALGNQGQSIRRDEEPVHDKALEWDAARTLAIFGGDEIMLRTVVAQYLKSIPLEMIELRQAVMQGNAQALAMAGHCLKGEIGYLAIPELSKPVCELEAMGRRGDLRSAARVLAELERMVSAVMISIQNVQLAMSKGSPSGELVTK